VGGREPQRRLKPHEIEALVAAYRGGMTMKDLARTFGIHRVTVSAYLRQQVVQIRGRASATRMSLRLPVSMRQGGRR
jgi:DNA-binding CsgD family transcriptional regulator